MKQFVLTYIDGTGKTQEKKLNLPSGADVGPRVLAILGSETNKRLVSLVQQPRLEKVLAAKAA